MPEFYAEPMKDRQSCSVCKKTVKGKKVLLTCINCHAITYCGMECQRADWERHEWNCVPVMVTEFPGKGRGLVAATDIKKGDLIFKDKPVIKLVVNAMEQFVDPHFMTSLKEQIESLPTEAKSQYFKLMARDEANTFNVSRSDFEVLKLFLANSNMYKDGAGDEESGYIYNMLHLNTALINHSCAPNAVQIQLHQKEKYDQDLCYELRAVKNIRKGEEITLCYYVDVKRFGSILRKRKAAMKKEIGFDCKCPICLGQVPGVEKTLKKMIEPQKKLNPTPSDWKREAGLWSRIVELTIELNMGDPGEKMQALSELARYAHLARDKDLRKKTMDVWRQIVVETKLEGIQRKYDFFERGLSQFSREFSSNSAPRKEEIDSILNRE